MKKHLLFIFLLLFSIACSSQKRDKNPEYSYQEFITGTTSMHFPNNDFYYQYKKQIFQIDTAYYLSILNFRHSRLTIFNIPNFELVYQKNNINFGGYVDAIDIHNFDTIYLLLRGNRMVQTDTSFNINREWNIKPISQEYGDNYFLGNPLFVTKSHFYVGHYPNYTVTTKQRRTEYFSKHNTMKLSFENCDSVLNYFGKFPEIYHRYNYDVTPCRFMLNNDYVITSFKETDSIYINNRAVASVHSNYFTKNKEKDLSKLNDTEYNDKRATENCGYGHLLYNPYTNHYYRMFHFATNYRNKNGTVNSPADAKKSIIVTDSNFNILKEIVLPPEYFIYDSYITPKGLMIKRENKNDKENIHFDFFNL